MYSIFFFTMVKQSYGQHKNCENYQRSIFELCDNIISRRDQKDLNEQSLLPLSAL